MKSVEIYSTPTCHFCKAAKEFLTEKGVEFTDYDVTQDANKRQEMLDKTGQMGVPVIVVGDEIMVGFDKNKLSEMVGITE